MTEARRPEAAVATLYETCSDEDGLARLAGAAGLSPAVDFEEADLRGLKAPGEDLSAFSFRGADLRDSDLRGARLARRALAGALLEGARLEGVVWVGTPAPDRPIFGWGEAWSEMGAESLEGWSSRIAPVDGKHRMSRETTRGFRRALPFYDRVELLAFIDEGWVNKRLVIYYLHDSGSLFRLNGTSPPLHEVNAKAPIRLSERDVLEYLRFFCFMVRGEEGPFHVLERADDPFLPVEMDETTRGVVEEAARPARLEGRNDHGHFLVNAMIFYANAIFAANFAVQPTGMVEMLDDEPRVADLPVRVQAPLA